MVGTRRRPPLCDLLPVFAKQINAPDAVVIHSLVPWRVRVPQVIATLPVNIDDEDVDLVIHRGEDPAAAVQRFCKEHMAESGEACESQLLPHVMNKLEEKGVANQEK